MLVFTQRLQKEYQQFQKLTIAGQQLITAVFSYNLIHPIFALFVNAFLWRESQDIFIVALYNLAFFAFLPMGFYLNGHLLKRNLLTPVQGYTLGGISRSITVFLLIFSSHLTVPLILFFGALYGICSGIFWSTRNFLSFKTTKSHDRIYFSSLDMLSGTITGILIPLAVGAFIVYGSTINTYTPLQAYYVVAFVLLAISILSGWQIRKLKIKPVITKIIIAHPSSHWMQSRAVMALFGLFNGALQFLSVFMILHFVGNEDALGQVQAIAAVLSAIVLYLVARKITAEKRLIIFESGTVLLILAGVSFALFPSLAGVVVFMTFFSLAQSLLWIGINSLNYDVIDKELKKNNNDYSYIFDSELFLNIGRVSGIVIFLVYSHVFSLDFALKLTPLVFGLSQIVLVMVARASHRRQRAEQMELQLTDQR